MKKITVNIYDAEVNDSYYSFINYSSNGYYVCDGTDEKGNKYELYYEMPEYDVQEEHNFDVSEFMDWTTPAFVIFNSKRFDFTKCEMVNKY